MPKVRDSSGTIGTMYLPTFLSLSSDAISVTTPVVVETSRPALFSMKLVYSASEGVLSSGACFGRVGTGPPRAARRSRKYFISGESSGGR
jgi:hypothetical protein